MIPVRFRSYSYFRNLSKVVHSSYTPVDNSAGDRNVVGVTADRPRRTKSLKDRATEALKDAVEGIMDGLGALFPEPEPQLVPVRVRPPRRPPVRRRR